MAARKKNNYKPKEFMALLIAFCSLFGLMAFLMPTIQVRKNYIVIKRVVNPYALLQKKPNLTTQKIVSLAQSDLVSTIKNQDPQVALLKLTEISKKNKVVLDNCHAIAHMMGRTSYDKYQDVNTAMQYADEVCGSGYIHGVIEEKIAKSNDILADVQSMCASNSGSCIHGMGHGLMYYTNNDLPLALQYCDSLPTSSERVFCQEGAFMENFNTDQELHPTKYLDKKNLLYPCTVQPAGYKSVCYFYQPDYYLTLNQNDFMGALKLCDTVESGYKSSCINGVGSRSLRRSMSDPKKIEKVCMSLDGGDQSQCIDGMVGYYLVQKFSVSKAQELCPLLETENQQQCYSSISRRSSLFPA